MTAYSDDGYTDYALYVNGAQSGLNHFQGIAEAYSEERGRGQAILEEWACQMSAALTAIESAYGDLKSYLENAQDKYQDWRSHRESENREQEIESARSAAHEKLWGH